MKCADAKEGSKNCSIRLIAWCLSVVSRAISRAKRERRVKNFPFSVFALTGDALWVSRIN